MAFSLGNGVINKDHSDGFMAILNSGLPNPSDNGTSVTFALPVPAAGGKRATGTVDNPNVTGLTSGHIASFTVDPTVDNDGNDGH